MSESNNGVQITTREIYDLTNNLVKEVNSLGNKCDRLEEKMIAQHQTNEEVKKTSNEALSISKEAILHAQEAQKDAERALKEVSKLKKEQQEQQLQEFERQRANRTKFLIALLSSLIPWLITAIIGVIYIFETKGG